MDLTIGNDFDDEEYLSTTVTVTADVKVVVVVGDYDEMGDEMHALLAVLS